MDTNQRKRKEKGGAEKAREKKVKSLAGEAYKCRKLTDLFGSSATTSTIISSLEQVQDDEENDEGASSDIQPASCVHDEGQRVELVEEPAQLAHISAEQEVGENYPLNCINAA